MLSSFQYTCYKILNISLSISCCFALGCTNEECNGNIESVVLLSKPETSFGGERIYVDVKNKGGVGVRKKLQCGNGIVGTFDNVVVIRDFRSEFKGRKKICFAEYYTMAPTDGAKMNDEGLPEIQLYQ